MTKTIRSIERGLQVLKALNATPISSLQDVYRLTRIPKPTLLRILQRLNSPAWFRAGWLTGAIASAPV